MVNGLNHLKIKKIDLDSSSAIINESIIEKINNFNSNDKAIYLELYDTDICVFSGILNKLVTTVDIGDGLYIPMVTYNTLTVDINELTIKCVILCKDPNDKKIYLLIHSFI